MLTCYDYSTKPTMRQEWTRCSSAICSGKVILGYEDTLSVTMEDTIHHTAPVARGAKNALVIADMPFMSYQASVYDAVTNAGRLMKEGRANAVKLKAALRSASRSVPSWMRASRSARIWALRRSRSMHSVVTRCKANQRKRLANT